MRAGLDWNLGQVDIKDLFYDKRTCAHCFLDVIFNTTPFRAENPT